MPTRHVLASALVLAISLTLSACWSNPGYDEKRHDHLDAAVYEFDLASLGKVICEYEDGQVSLNNGYSHTFLLEGTDPFRSINARFGELDYDEFVYDDHANFDRDDNIIGEVWISTQDQTGLHYEAQLRDEGCDSPIDGNVFVRFNETALASK